MDESPWSGAHAAQKERKPMSEIARKPTGTLENSVATQSKMDLVFESVKLASQLHSRQRKKKPIVPDIPYLGHLLEVAGIVQSNGGDETTVAAALLHDAIEDQGAEAREHIRAQLGQPVLEIVEACTESETFPKPPWRERKAAYLQQVEAASLPALLVMVADKLQNGRALLRRLTLQGAAGWGSPSREEKLWYLQHLAAALRRRLIQLEQETDHPTLVSVRLLIGEYAELVATLTRFGTPLVGRAGEDLVA
jgi:(p)ppGpp synthase/HD superfamily hydrolase